MKRYNKPVELIIKNAPPILSGESGHSEIKKKFSKSGIKAKIVKRAKPASSKSKSFRKPNSAVKSNLVLETDVNEAEVNPWDVAHVSLDSLGKHVSYIEPNFTQEFVVDRKIDVPARKITSKSLGSGKTDDNYDPDWNPHKNIVWHLGDKYSQLKSARDNVDGLTYNVRIGHIDTGYSKTHFAIPDSIRNNPLQRNFIDGEPANDSHDRLTGGLGKQPGHGTGTLGILAGKKINIPTDDGGFNDYLGGAYFAEVISCRIAESVILIKTNAFAEALNYLTQLSVGGKQIHVVSMSMGGAPSQIWADAVNAAYEAGITMVTAAGNNFAGLPTRHVIYPARFQRVIAACGVTYDFKPYWTRKLDEMQGCFGPLKHMSKALAAFTPNSPWASVESGTIRFSGAGTSSATPQIASAAAIYYRKYSNELDALPEKWQRVEAIRNALYKSALKKVNNEYDEDFREYFGNGIIQANEALNIRVPSDSSLQKSDEAEVPWFPILNTIFKARPDKKQSIRLDMFNTELAQLVYNNPDLSALIDDKKDYDAVSQRKWKQFTDAVISNPSTSVTLRNYLKEKKRK